ncbi:MAG: hypothetical protein DI589_25995 [Shinella sp.]|nr:MAG: hypothetical protein DI589_25995 [Shinella sp.]
MGAGHGGHACLVSAAERSAQERFVPGASSPQRLQQVIPLLPSSCISWLLLFCSQVPLSAPP